MTVDAEQVTPAWWIYQGGAPPHDGIGRLPVPPPWRAFASADGAEEPPAAPEENDSATVRRLGRWRQATSYRADEKETHLVNLALHLRRPLLVTGRPGIGKSTLAYSVAHELRLGQVLRWPITSRSTLADGQYQYDAVGRLHDVGLRQAEARAAASGQAGEPGADGRPGRAEAADIGTYLRLGPLGTAMLPWRRPRVLLIDEIDKSDLDLPNDLLGVFEEGEFLIPELARLDVPEARVMTADEGRWRTVRRGRVQCTEFPLVIMTSNEERDFPAAFLRRCLRLEISAPDEEKLARMVAAHLSGTAAVDQQAGRDLIREFLRKQREEGADLANDQLLNALLMASRGLWEEPAGRDLLDQHLLRPLDEG